MWRMMLGLVLGCTMAAPAIAQSLSLTAEPTPDAAPVADITITARHRVERLEAVPAAVSVIGRALLDRSYTVNTQQLALLVPSLNYSSANPRNTALTIRGLGSSVVAVSNANDGLEPGVGLYVDQVYHARPAAAAFDFTDIDQIEVLRGPQGTLFGKNTTAGTVSITTAPPSFTRAATGELSVGSFNFVQAKASATGPLAGDSVAFRLSALTTRRDGIIRNVRNGARHNAIGNQAVRGQVLLSPSEAFTLRLTADFTNFASDCCTQVYLRVGQSLRPAARQYPFLAANAPGGPYAPPSLNVYDRVTDIDAPIGVDTNEGGVSAIADWNAGPVTLTSVSAWRFWNWDAANDRDFTGIAVQLVQHIPSRQDQYSQEIRLASTGDRRLGYVAGLYYFSQKITGRPISIFGPAGAYYLVGTTTGATGTPVPADLLDGYASDGNTRFKTDSYAAFGEANWRLTPRLTLTGGLRYTYERKSANYDLTVSGGPPVTSAALLNARLSVLRPQRYSARDAEGNVSGRANLGWAVSDNVYAYFSYARGFKSGGINLSGLPLDNLNQPVLATAVIRPEVNTTYEAGLKGQLYGRRLIVNLAGFSTRVRDFQATIVDSSQTVALRGFLSNIPAVTVNGFELDATAQLTPQLQLRGATAFADGRYTSYPQGPCPLEVQTSTTAACNLSGQRLVGLPRWSTTIGGDFALLATRRGSIALHADASLKSSYDGDATLSRFTVIKGYAVTNASIGYRSAKGWEVAVFARNLFAANYIQNLTIQAGNSGLIVGNPSDPRVIGITFRAQR